MEVHLDYESLTKRLRDAEERAKEAEKRAEEEKKHAEEERKRAEEAEKQTRETTFLEFLYHSHIHCTEPLTVQSDKKRSTGGTTVQPYGCCYPSTLRHWEDFMDGQQGRFDILRDVFHPKSQSNDTIPPPTPPALRLFPSISHTQGKGHDACRRPLASEDDLKFYQRCAIESPVTDIINVLSNTSHPSTQEFHLGNGVSFENHQNTLDESSQEASQGARQEASQESSESSLESSRGDNKRQRVSKSEYKKIRRGPSDQICVYYRPDGKCALAFVVEYKAPHKISVDAFRWALKKPNLCEEVWKRYKSYSNAKDQENAEDIAGKVVSQTFNYMIEKRVEYGYITTGEAYIFLRVGAEDPSTLYYHLVAPKEEVRDESEKSMFHSAIGQVTCFCLMTLSKRRSRKWQKRAFKKLEKWPHPHENTGHYITEEEMEPSSSPSAYEPSSPITISQASNYNLRSKSKSKSTCRDPEITGQGGGGDDGDRDDDGDDDGDDDNVSRIPYRAGPGNAGVPRKSGHASTSNDSSEDDYEPEPQNRPYCTQACLLGLKKGGILDENCPNVSSHRTPGSAYHPIDVERVAVLVREQIEEDPDRDVEPLEGKQGARGALLKLTLTGYGYTFVAKGTVSVFVRHLRHEGRIYRRLERLQGRVVPVYLGETDLITSYCLDAGVWLVHLMLMSWGGEMVDPATVPNLQEEEERSLKELRSEGVAHGDTRYANMLWNTEQQRVMLIDFDRACFLRPPRNKQLSQLCKKKKRQIEAPETYHRKRMVMGTNESQQFRIESEC